MKKNIIIIIFVVLGLISCSEQSNRKVDNLELAKFYAENGTYSLAINILQQEIQSNPENIVAIKMLSGFHYDLEYFLDANKNIEKAVELGCKSEDCNKLYINILISNNKINEAERLLKLIPNTTNSEFYKLKNAHIKYLKDKNLKSLEKIVSLMSSVDAREILLKAYYENNRFVEIYNSKIEGEVYSIDELLIYSRTAYILEKFEESERILLEIRLKDNSDVITRRKIEAVEQLVKVNVALGKISEADIIYKAFLTNNESTGYSLFNKALVDLKSNNFDAAIRNIEGMVKTNPTNLQSSLILALAYYGKNDFKSVISTLSSFKEVLDTKGRLLLAISYINSGNPKDAVDFLSENDLDDASRLALARAAFLIGDRDKAISLVEVIKVNKDSTFSEEQFAEFLYTLGMYMKLISQFELRNEASYKVKLLVIDSYFKSNQIDAAKQYVKKQSGGMENLELKAYVYIKQNKLNDGIKIYEKIISERESKIDYIKLAGLYLKEKKTAKIFETIVKGFELKGDNLQLLRLINTLLATEKSEDYIKWLESISEDQKDYKSIQVLLALYDIRFDRKDKVIERLSRFESEGDIKISLILAMAKNNNQNASINLLEDALKDNFSMRVAQVLFEYYSRKNDSENLSRIIDTIEKNSGLTIYSAPILSRGYLRLNKFDKAYKAAEFLSINGQKFLANDIKGDISYLEEDYDEALMFYKKNIDLSPNEKILIKYFRIKFNFDKYEPVKTLLEADKWIVKFPNMFVLTKFIATKYIGVNNEKSIKYFKILLDKFPNNIEILNNYAWVVMDVDLELALELSTRAFTLNPDDLNISDTYLLALQNNKKITEAKKLLDDLIKKNPGNRMLQIRLNELNKAS